VTQDAENAYIVPSVRNTHTFHHPGITQLYPEFSSVLGMYRVNGQPGANSGGVRGPEITSIYVFLVGYKNKRPGMDTGFLAVQTLLGRGADLKGMVRRIIRQDILISYDRAFFQHDCTIINFPKRTQGFMIGQQIDMDPSLRNGLFLFTGYTEYGKDGKSK